MSLLIPINSTIVFDLNYGDQLGRLIRTYGNFYLINCLILFNIILCFCLVKETNYPNLYFGLALACAFIAVTFILFTLFMICSMLIRRSCHLHDSDEFNTKNNNQFEAVMMPPPPPIRFN